MSADLSVDPVVAGAPDRGAAESPTGDGPSAAVRWGALALVLVGSFVTVLDYFIVNVAIPSVQTDLHTSRAQIELVIAGYGVAFTAGLIACGRLGDLFGRRRMFAIGLTVFTAASLACGLAPTADFLVAARIVQGIGASILVPQVLGIVGVAYTGEHRAKAFTVYGLVIGLAGVFGQIIGGALISADIAGSDWRSVFLINVPIGIVALCLVNKVLPKPARDRTAKLDVVGALLVTAVLGLIVACLVEGREQGWPVWSWVGLIVAVVLADVTVWHLRRQARSGGHPLIAPSMFANRTFSVGLGATFVYFLAMGSFFFLFALFVQEGRGFSALQSGTLFMAVGAGYFGSSIASVGLAQKLGSKLVVLGPLTVAAGYGFTLLTVSQIGDSGAVAWLIPSLIVAGVGMGMTTGPLTNIVLTGTDPEHAAAASGAVNTAQEGGSAIGVAIAGAVFYPILGAAGRISDYPHAFEIGLLPLIGFALLAAVVAELLPRATAAKH